MFRCYYLLNVGDVLLSSLFRFLLVCGDVTIKLNEFNFRAILCTASAENRLQGLFLEMNPDGSVRGSPEQRQNCKQLLQTKVKEPEYIH